MGTSLAIAGAWALHIVAPLGIGALMAQAQRLHPDLPANASWWPC